MFYHSISKFVFVFKSLLAAQGNDLTLFSHKSVVKITHEQIIIYRQLFAGHVVNTRASFSRNAHGPITGLQMLTKMPYNWGGSRISQKGGSILGSPKVVLGRWVRGNPPPENVEIQVLGNAISDVLRPSHGVLRSHFIQA